MASIPPRIGRSFVRNTNASTFTCWGFRQCPRRRRSPRRSPANCKATATRSKCCTTKAARDLYVTGNLYRPANPPPGERLPAVLYVCGHLNQGRAGNKTAYQSHGIWFARHGYVCLVLDSLELGEIAATHHGTYREGRWWWHSRGYTPAGVECLNGIRGIDYLPLQAGRRSAADRRHRHQRRRRGHVLDRRGRRRVSVAVPVSGMADLASYVSNRVINGHCDCMFFYNTFQWPWTRIAAMVAPRPLLVANSDQDRIFPMDANDRVINRLKRVYSLLRRQRSGRLLAEHGRAMPIARTSARASFASSTCTSKTIRGSSPIASKIWSTGEPPTPLPDRARTLAGLPHRRRHSQGRVEHHASIGTSWRWPKCPPPRAGGFAGLEDVAAGGAAAGDVPLLSRADSGRAG